MVSFGHCSCICGQLSFPPLLLPLCHVALSHPRHVTLEYTVSTYLRLSFLFFDIKMLTFTWQNYYKDYTRIRQRSILVSLVC